MKTQTKTRRVTLGMTGLAVSPIAFGTWQLRGDWGEFDEDEGIAAIRRARELGVKLFDTAQGSATFSTCGKRTPTGREPPEIAAVVARTFTPESASFALQDSLWNENAYR